MQLLAEIVLSLFGLASQQPHRLMGMLGIISNCGRGSGGKVAKASWSGLVMISASMDNHKVFVAHCGRVYNPCCEHLKLFEDRAVLSVMFLFGSVRPIAL